MIIISFILMTLMFDSGVIFKGEITSRYLSLSGIKGLKKSSKSNKKEKKEHSGESSKHIQYIYLSMYERTSQVRIRRL